MARDALPADADYSQLRIAAKARLRIEELRERELYTQHPWPFFENRVRLIDPLAPPGEQIADYPSFPYCRHLIQEWEDHNQSIVWKPRRMIVSWSALIYCVAKAAHLPNQRIFLVSRVEGDSASEGARELIWRAHWVVQHLKPGPKIRVDDARLILTFPDTGSTITGMGGNEPNKLRGVAGTIVFLDEFGFWEKPEEAYQALRPTLEGRGKVIAACTTTGGFFKQLVYDEAGTWTERQLQKDRPDTAKEVVKYLDGMEAWTNAGNGFRVIALDYWADPRKQKGSEWEAKEKAGTTNRAWRTEYCREFLGSSGLPVFMHEWDQQRMIYTPTKDELEERRYRPLVVGLDFGYQRPAITVSWFQAGRIWKVLRAHIGQKIHFTPFMRQVKVLLDQWFPDHEGGFLWCCDAAGKHQGSDAEPEVEILRKMFGIRPRFQWSLIPPTIDRMRDYMCDVHQKQPCFQVERHPSTRIIIDALNGQYCYPEAKSGHPEPEEPDKDGFYDHPMDALRYTVLNFGGKKKQQTVDYAAISRRDILAPHRYTVT